jgi:hypothetical protein
MYGMTTKRDLTSLIAFMTMGLIGIIIASVVNIFIRSSGMSMIINYIGVIVFVGLTAYDTQKVKVAVEDGNVVLFGTVALYIQKMRYEQIAWKTGGVVAVDNEIRVVPKLPQTDLSIERKIMDIMHTHSRYHGTGFKIKVEAGEVSIGGTFEHPRDVLFLKHRVAEIEGVVDVNLLANFRI